MVYLWFLFYLNCFEFVDDRENADEEESTDEATFESIDVDDTMTQESAIFCLIIYAVQVTH